MARSQDGQHVTIYQAISDSEAACETGSMLRRGRATLADGAYLVEFADGLEPTAGIFEVEDLNPAARRWPGVVGSASGLHARACVGLLGLAAHG